MPRVFYYCRFDKFPELQVNQELTTGGQLDLIKDQPIRGAHSIVRYLGVSDNPDYKKYYVNHEIERKLRHREGLEVRDELIAVIEFHIFQHKSGFFMVGTNRKHVRELYSRMAETMDGSTLLLKAREVDLDHLCDAFNKNVNASSTVSGGYFSRLKIDRVRSASLFGPDVIGSEMWKQLKENGDLGGVWVDFDYYGSKMTSLITSHGVLLLLNNLDEKAALEVTSFLEQLMAPYSKEEPISILHRRR